MAKWGDGRESGPGPKGNASGCRGFRIEGIGAGKISAHNHMEWLRNCEKGPFPAGDATAGNAGESGAREESCGERLACCIVFFPAILWCAPPLLGGDRFSVPHGDCVRHPFGIPGRAGPVLVALRQQAGRAILYHIIFLIMSILYHGKKLRTPSFQCPAYARSAATEWQALVIKKFVIY